MGYFDWWDTTIQIRYDITLTELELLWMEALVYDGFPVSRSS